MNWNDLSMAQKSELMRIYIRNGVTSLNAMSKHFNTYANGGPKKPFNEWSNAMKAKYPWLELDSQKAGYDYNRYYEENYDDAWSRLEEKEARHFTDRYKLPNHLTYSDESVYSEGPSIGGSWTKDDKFIPSVINIQQHHNVYKEYRPYTEDEIYGRKFAAGGNMSPDWDPDNPYHYHTKTGEKAVITPEDWEKHKGQPYFKRVEDAVLAEQAAHPGPEYIINPQFSEDLRRVYKGNMGPKYQNYSSFSSNLPQGYNFIAEGLVQDNQGNLYVQKGFRQTPRFTYDENNPLTFPVLEGRNQGNVTFYPVNMERTIKPSLPISSIMNVDKEHESAIRKAQNQYEYAISPMFDLRHSDLENPKYEKISYITNLIGRAVNTSDPYEDIIVSPAEFALIKSNYKKDKNKEYIKAIHEHPEWDNSFYWEWINQDNPWMWQNPDGTYTDSSPKPRKISRKEAEKKAVIEIGPLQVDKIEAFNNGGYLFS